MAYDTKCFDLAEAFLEDEPLLNNEPKRKELAQLIQTTIEDFIIYERNHAAPAQAHAPIFSTSKFDVSYPD